MWQTLFWAVVLGLSTLLAAMAVSFADGRVHPFHPGAPLVRAEIVIVET